MIPLFKVYTAKGTGKELEKVLDSGYIGEGQKVKELEQQINTLFGYEGIKLVNSGTSAIDLTMHMMDVGHGDEVITTPITCTATNSPAHLRGATLIWGDVHPQTGLLLAEDVEKKITKKTKAIIAVNWGGLMPDYTKLKSFGIPVLEDAAHGAYWTNNERGNYVAWSFQAIKHLTSGDGGALLSPNPDRARLLRWFGLDRESNADFRCAQNIQELGYKYHMNDISATIGLMNIQHMQTLVQLHNRNASIFDRNIRNTKIVKPVYSADHPFWLYTLLVDRRDVFIQYLKDNGIASSQVHARNDKHDGFHRVRYAYQNTGVDFFDNHQVSIPVGWWLNDSDLEYIIDIVNKWR